MEAPANLGSGPTYYGGMSKNKISKFRQLSVIFKLFKLNGQLRDYRHINKKIEYLTGY